MIETRRDGFTLVEVLIVVVILGVVAAAIAAAFSIIVRTAPPTEARADDARSLLGLTTWLPADVSAVPQVPVATAVSNWDDDPSRLSGCGTDPGSNIVRLSWRESVSGSPVTFIASYRHVDDGDVSRIVRVACRSGGPTEVLNLTADLPPSATEPARLTWRTDARGGVDHVIGLTLELTTLRGETMRVDASSRNPNATLGTIPAAVTTTSTTSPTSTSTTTTSTTTSTSTSTTTVVSGSTTTTLNGAPTAGPVAATFQRDAESFPVSLAASDPDDDPLTVEVTALPTGWTATVTGLDVRFTAADPAAGVYVIDYAVTDPAMLTATSTVTIELTPVPCSASFLAVAPNPVDRTGNGNPAYPLAEPVDVDIVTAGDCGDLELRYTPTATVVRTPEFGGSVRLTIPGGTGTDSWDHGDRVLELILGASVLDTASLRVEKN